MSLKPVFDKMTRCCHKDKDDACALKYKREDTHRKTSTSLAKKQLRPKDVVGWVVTVAVAVEGRTPSFTAVVIIRSCSKVEGKLSFNTLDRE